MLGYTRPDMAATFEAKELDDFKESVRFLATDCNQLYPSYKLSSLQIMNKEQAWS